MYQLTTSSLSQTIWPRWASRQFLWLPVVQTLLPVTFAYSLNSEAVVMRQLMRWKRLWRRSLTRSQKRISMVQQMHWSRGRLLRRGREFHVCTVNKSAHTKKVWKLIVCTSYIYIYIFCVVISKYFLHTVISNVNILKKLVFDSDMGTEQKLPLWIRNNLAVMAITMYATLPKTPFVEPQDQMQFSILPKKYFERETYRSVGNTDCILSPTIVRLNTW